MYIKRFWADHVDLIITNQYLLKNKATGMYGKSTQHFTELNKWGSKPTGLRN